MNQLLLMRRILGGNTALFFVFQRFDGIVMHIDSHRNIVAMALIGIAFLCDAK